MEITKLDEAKVQFDKIKNVMVKPKGSNTQVPLGSLMGAANLGYTVPLDDNNIDNLYKDTKTGKYLVMYKDGSTKDVNQLSGKELTSVGKGSITVNVGDKVQLAADIAEATTKAKDVADMSSMDYYPKLHETLVKTNRNYRMLSNSPDLTEKAQARDILIKSALSNAEAKTEDPITYVPGKGIYSVETTKDGAVVLDKDGKPKLKKRYAGDPK
jgi:hypothetical protein